MRFEPLFNPPTSPPPLHHWHTSSRYGRHHKRASSYSYLLEQCEESKAKQARPKRTLVLFMHPGVQHSEYSQGSGSGYSQGNYTLDKASGSGSGYSQRFWLWIQQGVQYSEYSQGSGSRYSQRFWLWIHKGSSSLDTAIGRQYSEYNQGSGSEYSQGSNTLDKARGSGSGCTQGQGFSTIDKARGAVLWIQPGYCTLDTARCPTLWI